MTATLREVALVAAAAAVLLAGVTGGGTQAALQDAETTDPATITLARHNQGSVSFSGCRKVSLEPANASDVTVVLRTTGGSYTFEETDFNGNSYQLKRPQDFPKNEDVRNVTLDGTTYENPNYPGC